LDISGDEKEGRDEYLVGYNTKFVSDDVLIQEFSKIPKNSRIVMVIDACHSGTMVDLKYQFVYPNAYGIVSNREPVSDRVMITISGCKDSQLSEETFRPDSGKWEGVLTRNFVEVISTDSSANQYTWGEFINRIVTKIASEPGNHKQIPQLSSNDITVFNQALKI
jgi:hypothetical protein